MKKIDIETYYVHGQGLPSIDVKVRATVRRYAALLPLELGQVASYDAATGTVGPLRKITTDAGFTLDWIEENVSDEERYGAFQAACEDRAEQAVELAQEMFGPHVSVYFEGRQGGHLVVHDLPDLDTWDAIMVSRWSRFEKRVQALVADVPYGELWNLNAWHYEPAQEEVERAARDEQVARDELEESRAMALAAAVTLGAYHPARTCSWA